MEIISKTLSIISVARKRGWCWGKKRVCDVQGRKDERIIEMAYQATVNVPPIKSIQDSAARHGEHREVR